VDHANVAQNSNPRQTRKSATRQVQDQQASESDSQNQESGSELGHNPSRPSLPDPESFLSSPIKPTMSTRNRTAGLTDKPARAPAVPVAEGEEEEDDDQEQQEEKKEMTEEEKKAIKEANKAKAQARLVARRALLDSQSILGRAITREEARYAARHHPVFQNMLTKGAIDNIGIRVGAGVVSSKPLPEYRTVRPKRKGLSRAERRAHEDRLDAMTPEERKAYRDGKKAEAKIKAKERAAKLKELKAQPGYIPPGDGCKQALIEETLMVLQPLIFKACQIPLSEVHKTKNGEVCRTTLLARDFEQVVAATEAEYFQLRSNIEGWDKKEQASSSSSSSSAVAPMAIAAV